MSSVPAVTLTMPRHERGRSRTRTRHERGRSRSRSIRRRARREARREARQEGNSTLSFGRHGGRTFFDMLRNEPGYCRWAVSQPYPGGGLRVFAEWLRRQPEEGEVGSSLGGSSDDASDDSDEELPPPPVHRSRPSRPPAPTSSRPPTPTPSRQSRTQRHRAPATPERVAARSQKGLSDEKQALLQQLPRIVFSQELFSKSQHPDSCPICMEDWGDVTGEAGEILLTPCLHVFHVTCLSDWLRRRTDCPSCRWDVTDTGDQGVPEERESVPSTAPAPSIRQLLAGVTVEVSDDSAE